MARHDSRPDLIREFISRNGSVTGPEIADHLGVTRQAVSLHLRKLIAAGVVFKTGSTRGARYFPSDAAPPPRRFKRTLALEGLDESVVYEKLAVTLNLPQLRKNLEPVLRYAFTEMLNNAIDHSKSAQCALETWLDATRMGFSVKDHGIGVFHSIADKFRLEDEHAAMIELIKGKTTTQPHAHSGEGIFFVSRAADRFVLRSHRLQIEWNRDREDVFVSDGRFLKGTLVRFEVGKDSRTRLEDVFGEFAPEKYDFQFQKTRILVKLLRSEYVSRSEAKRLLHNLDKFKEIELDMREVSYVGQGFTDEIFRVYASTHPHIEIRASNTGKAVDAMIRHIGRP